MEDSRSDSGRFDDLPDPKVATGQARTELRKLLFNSIRNAENLLIDAPTAVGKSHLISSTHWRKKKEITGGQPVILLSKTREARKQANKISEASGLNTYVIEGRNEACPLCRGEFDNKLEAPNGDNPSDWFAQRCNQDALLFSEVHQRWEKKKGESPCNGDDLCPALAQYGEVAENISDFDIIHATHNIAYVEDLIENANVIFDERPSFKFTFGNGEYSEPEEHERLERAISDLLSERAEENYSYSEVMHATKFDLEGLESTLRNLLSEDPEEDWLFESQYGHNLAAQVARAILNSKLVCEDSETTNDRYHGQEDRLQVVFDERDIIRCILRKPPLSEARCVIGLDAHPIERLWHLNTVSDMKRESLLTPKARYQWRLKERNLYVVQVGEADRAYTSGWRSAGEEKAQELIRGLRKKYGGRFQTAICPKSIKEDITEMMHEVGIKNPKVMHYGSQESRNDFAEQPCGVVIGCIDPGDHNIMDNLALCELEARPKTTEEDGETRRKFGREFIGPDADAAEEFLRAVRENNVAQAIGRYARAPKDATNNAIVYAWTATVPEPLTDEKIEDVEMTSEGFEEIHRTLRKESESTARNLAEKTDYSRAHVYEVLEELEEEGVVSIKPDAGHQGADIYRFEDSEYVDTVDLDIQGPQAGR